MKVSACKVFAHVFVFMNFFLINADGNYKFFPFGVSEGDVMLQEGDDEISLALKLGRPLQFYDMQFNIVYVSTNGILSPQPPPNEAHYVPGTFPLSFPAIAPLLLDVDTSLGRGAVYYRMEESLNMLNRVTEMVQLGFPETHFRATHLVITTWDHVASFKDVSQTEYWISSCQAILAGNKTDTYALFLYPEDGLQFSGERPQSEIRALAGFSRGDTSTHNELFYSVSTSDLTTKSLFHEGNAGAPGMWIFHIGSSRDNFQKVVPAAEPLLPPADANAPQDREGSHVTTAATADFNLYNIYTPGHINATAQPSPLRYQDAPPTPLPQALGAGTTPLTPYSQCGAFLQHCSKDSYCKDYSTGPCCHCRSGFYGNGLQCLPKGVSQRVSGKLNGLVSMESEKIRLDAVDVHGYAVVEEGRVYVSLSPVPQRAGWALMALNPLVSLYGWLFSLELQNHQNGFSITGAEFVHQAEVTFYPGKQRMNIMQEARGLDSFNHVKVEIQINGNLPSIPNGANVQIQPYKETLQYNQSVITSSSLNEYMVVSENGGSETVSYLLHQNISIKRCEHGPRTEPDFQQLSLEHALVMYSSEGSILKYGLMSSVGPVGGELPKLVKMNPCRSGKHYCDPMALCVPREGLQYHCQCTVGFTGDGQNCYDVDECSEDPSPCGLHSDCVNMPGGHHCHCQTGYEFDLNLRECVDMDECALRLCHPLASCSNTHGSFRCQCWPGYKGDGFLCKPQKENKPEKALCGRHRELLQEGILHWGAEAMMEAYVPQCDEIGQYKALQCLGTTGHCWCVDSRGQERLGTRTLPGMPPPNCDQPAPLVPRAETLCERWRTTLLSHYGGRPNPRDYMPQCDAHGHFLSVQCYGNSSYCWCVDDQGRELRGTRSYHAVKPPCISAVALPVSHSLVYPVVSSSPSVPALLFAQGSQIEIIPLDKSVPIQEKSSMLLSVQDSVVMGISYDCQENTLYWTDVARHSINRVSLVFGAEPVTIIHTDVGQPEGIALDLQHRKLFWVDSEKDRIEVADLEGHDRKVLIDSDLVNPRAIVVDTSRSVLFWTDWNRDAPRIESFSLKDLHRKVLVHEGLSLPNALTLDPLTNHLCWADAGTKKLECIATDGTERQEVKSGLHYPFSLVIYNNHVYYTDWERDGIVVIEKNTGREIDSFPIQRYRPYGITVIQSQCL